MHVIKYKIMLHNDVSVTFIYCILYNKYYEQVTLSDHFITQLRNYIFLK